MLKTKEGIVINKMGEGVSLRAIWYEGGRKTIPIKKEDVEELLPVVVANLFTIRDLKKNIFKE